MKILFIAPRYSGGVGGHVSRIIPRLKTSGFEIEIMHIPHIPIKNLKNPSFTIFGIIQALLKKESYDVVHAFNVPSAFIMKYIKAKKKILAVHGVYSEQIELMHSKSIASLISGKEKQVLEWADVLTTDSLKVKIDYKNKLNLDVVHLPSPLDVKKLENISKTLPIKNQILYLGRDSYEKGIDILKNIESKINGKVVYCTNLTWEETMILLKKSNLIVVPSRMESLPTNIKEAFYLKIPVVASNIGGIPELVTHNKTGILIPNNDSNKLSHEINNLLNNEEKAKIFSENAYEFVTKNLTWKIILPKYIQFYEKLLS